MVTSSLCGKVAVFEHCPPALADAVARKNVAVFCGAGISMAPPSGVPSWSGFNEALFSQIKARAGTLPGLSSEATRILEGMTVIYDEARKKAQVLPTEGFSDAVADLLLSDEYFPALKILNGERCNASHEALAWLAKAGAVRAIATTNFDTLIERAFEAARVEFDPFISREDYDRGAVESARPGLYKVHGSVDAPGSQKDTATQKFQGLPLYVRARLAELFRDHHVLVIGFSGGDLKFGDDYLGFAQLSADGPGVTWVVRPPRKPEDALVSERVRELLERAGERAAVVKIELAELFNELGIPPSSSENHDGDFQAAETRANERAANDLRIFFEAKALAPVRCATFCAKLLRGAGRPVDARAIEAALAEILQNVGEDPAQNDGMDAAIGTVLLTEAAFDDNEPQRGNEWAFRVLRLAERAKTRGQAAAAAADASRWRKIESLAWNFRGQYLISCTHFAEAAKALARAGALLESNGGEFAALSAIQSNEAYLAWKADAPREDVLELIRRSEALARQAGQTSAIAAAAHFESLILVSLGEYDPALRALERGLDAVSVSGNARDKASLVVEQAKIALARGEIEPAFRQMHDLIGKLRDHPGLTAGLFISTVEMLGFHPPLRVRLLEMADAFLPEFQRGRIPVEGRPPNVPSRAGVERVRDALAANRLPANRAVPSYSEPPRDREEELRRLIIEYEFAGRRSELPKCFLELFHIKLGQGDPARIMDVAVALGRAAEREHDDALQLEACCQRMLAWQRAGELRKALAEFEQLTCNESALALPIVAAIQHMAGVLHSLIGSPQGTEALLRSALALDLRSHNAAAVANDVLALASAAARGGDYRRGIEILKSEAGLIGGAGSPDMLDKSAVMLERFQRGQARRESAMPVSIGLSEPLRRGRLTADDAARLRLQAATAEELLMLARYALGSGQTDAAHELVLEASLAFGALRDRRGIADCLSFLADIAQTERQWEKALDFSRMASEAGARMDDPAREIASLAVVAFCLYKLDEPGEAGETAARCLRRADRRPPSRPALIACFVRAASCEQSGDIVGKFASMAGFLEGYPSVDGVEDLGPLRDSFQRVLRPDGR